MKEEGKICDLLRYAGVPEDDLEKVYDKIYFWSFVVSLSDQLEERGSLSEKQESTLVNLIKKHTDVECDKDILTHSTKYKRKGGKKCYNKRIAHSYGKLLDIQLYDLPFESGTIQTLDFYPYSKHTVVIKIKEIFYRVPLPKNWDEPAECTSITFKYRRTKCKGYMETVN